MSAAAALTAAGSVFLPILLVLALYRSRRRQQAAPLAARFGGRVSPMGDAVRFQYEGAAWEVQRIASVGGLAGTGSYACLALALECGPALVVAPEQAMKYVYAAGVPRQHSACAPPSARLLVVGQAHAQVAAALDAPASAALLEPLFARPYSTLRVYRETRVVWGRLPYRQWMLRLTGLPDDVYRQPDALKLFLDNIILLCGRIGLRIDRGFRFS